MANGQPYNLHIDEVWISLLDYFMFILFHFISLQSIASYNRIEPWFVVSFDAMQYMHY